MKGSFGFVLPKTRTTLSRTANEVSQAVLEHPLLVRWVVSQKELRGHVLGSCWYLQVSILCCSSPAPLWGQVSGQHQHQGSPSPRVLFHANAIVEYRLPTPLLRSLTGMWLFRGMLVLMQVSVLQALYEVRARTPPWHSKLFHAYLWRETEPLCSSLVFCFRVASKFDACVAGPFYVCPHMEASCRWLLWSPWRVLCVVTAISSVPQLRDVSAFLDAALDTLARFHGTTPRGDQRRRAPPPSMVGTSKYGGCIVAQNFSNRPACVSLLLNSK